MELITWDVDDVEDTISELDNLIAVNRLRISLADDKYDTDNITLDDAISLIKHSLIGEYHGILVSRREELLADSDAYLLTFDSDVSDGGCMKKIDWLLIRKISSK